MSNGINTISVKNCNNISSGKLDIHENCLNLFMASNGTGKSTVAKAIYLQSNELDLLEIKSYGCNENPSIRSTRPLGQVMVFDEDFVNEIVFKENEVIENSFDVFIKSPTYDERLRNVNERLHGLKTEISDDDEITSLLQIFTTLTKNIVRNSDGSIRQNPFYKSIRSKEHLFKIPQQIIKFRPFIQSEYTVEWIDWKNKGFQFDDQGACPFCTEKFCPTYEEEKHTFSTTYTKSSAKNLKEFLTNLVELKEYITSDKFHYLEECIKTMTDVDEIEMIISQFITEINYFTTKTNQIIKFDSLKISSEDIKNLDDKISNLKISPSMFNMFNTEKTLAIISRINKELELILFEVNEVKREIGMLQGVIIKSANEAADDINNFLETAGINYELLINVDSESESSAILKYKDREDNSFAVENIKRHLSWGERNAFALVLFMHYALSQKPELIILDDPISSFDKNKKFAIINRLFNTVSNKRTFYRQTVLFMTHDLEPVIDFVVNNKPTGGFVKSFHLHNKNGELLVTPIRKSDFKPQIRVLTDIIKEKSNNIICRLISLRKYIELTDPSDEKNIAYDIISSALKSKVIPDKKISNSDFIDLTDEEIMMGEKFICKWIPNYSYENMIQDLTSLESLVEFYKEEKCSYFKIQLFRLIISREIIKNKVSDDTLLNFIDKTYHVENDYLYSLDFHKFEMIPDFIILKCDQFISANFAEFVDG